MENGEKTTGLWIVAASVLVLVTVIWLYTPKLIPWLFALGTEAQPPVGLFEIVNTLFSGLAFAGVVAAILLQRRELQLQRAELEETRRELKGQKEALVGQNDLLRLANIHQVLVPLLMEYRSEAMYDAITALWTLREQHPDDFVAEYERQSRENSRLHYQSRSVSHFYGLLSGLYSVGVVPPEVLYSYWSERDLRIIPQVILPIERELERSVFRGSPQTPGKDLAAVRWAQMMQKLYDDAPRTAV